MLYSLYIAIPGNQRVNMVVLQAVWPTRFIYYHHIMFRTRTNYIIFLIKFSYRYEIHQFMMVQELKHVCYFTTVITVTGIERVKPGHAHVKLAKTEALEKQLLHSVI